MSFTGADAIIASLETAAKAVDLTGPVYARLFAQFPETEALFVLDRDGQVRGAMLAQVFETIFDFIGERRYAHRLIGAEIVTHEGYGVPPEAFAAFFAVVCDEVREACGREWTEAMADAWTRLLADLNAYTGAAGKTI